MPEDPADPYGVRSPGPYVLFGPRGELRCTTERTFDAPGFVDLTGGVLWIDGVATRVDRTDCSTRPGLLNVVDGGWVADAVNGVVVVAEGDVVAVHSADTGRRLAESERLGGEVTSAAVAEGSIWALAGTDLVQLDPDTLEIVHRAGPLDCGGAPLVLGAATGSVWVVDDCSGILAEVDPASGDYVESWWLPHDGESDQEIAAALVDDGIWLVDVEQTGEPYRFDLTEHRFERMPISRDVASSIYALVWQVFSRR